jgi:mRNA interferase YafQ
MYEIHRSNKFKKSYKRVIKSGSFSIEDCERLISLIVNGFALPDCYHDHILKGNYSGLHECHIKGDCLLIYEIDDKYNVIYLINIGNHANIFE